MSTLFIYLENTLLIVEVRYCNWYIFQSLAHRTKFYRSHTSYLELQTDLSTIRKTPGCYLWTMSSLKHSVYFFVLGIKWSHLSSISLGFSVMYLVWFTWTVTMMLLNIFVLAILRILTTSDPCHYCTFFPISLQSSYSSPSDTSFFFRILLALIQFSQVIL